MAKKKIEVNENSGLFKFSYNGGILMFDIYYENGIDPRELTTKVKNSIEKTNSENLLSGIASLIDEINTSDKWEDIKKLTKRRKEIKDIKNTEQLSDYYLRFVAYNCLKILKNEEKIEEYLKKLGGEMNKYFPKETVAHMIPTLNVIAKLIKIAPKVAMKEELTKKLKSIKDLKEVKKL